MEVNEVLLVYNVDRKVERCVEGGTIAGRIGLVLPAMLELDLD